MKRLFRLLSAAMMAVTLLVILGGAAALYLVNNYDGGLPDHRQLADYEPPTATRVHAGDGRLIAEYARQNRMFVPSEAIPERVKQAFIAAEDQHFYDHPGVDVFGIGRAVLSNLQRMRRQSPARRRFHDHAAGGQELPLEQRALLRAQVQGDHPGAAHRARLHQGADPRALSERDLPGQPLLWRRRSRAELLRQVAGRAQHRRGRALGRACPRPRPATIRSTIPRRRWHGATMC